MIVLQPLPVILIDDFNAHHPYWNDKTSNKLGNELFEFLSDKDLTPMIILRAQKLLRYLPIQYQLICS